MGWSKISACSWTVLPFSCQQLGGLYKEQGCRRCWGGHVGDSSRRSWMQALLGPDGGLPMVSNIPRVNVEFLWLFLQQDLLTSPR